MTAPLFDIRQNGSGQTLAALRSGRQALKPGLRALVERETLLLERDVKQKSLTGAKGSHPIWGVTGASGDALGARSGDTRRRVVRRVFEALGSVIGVVGSPDPKVKLHEHGGVISGRPLLRIPTRRAQTGAGVDRWLGVSARDIPNAFLFRARNRGLWIATREPAGGLQLLYKLVPRVVLRARKMFTRALERRAAPIIASAQQFGVRITTQLNGGR